MPPLMRKQRCHCHSERSRAESKNLKWLSQRKADRECPDVDITLGHDIGALLAAGSAVTDLGFLPALGMTERRGPDRSCKSVLPTPSVISTPSAVNPQNLAPRTPSPSNTPPLNLTITTGNATKCHTTPQIPLFFPHPLPMSPLPSWERACPVLRYGGWGEGDAPRRGRDTEKESSDSTHED